MALKRFTHIRKESTGMAELNEWLAAHPDVAQFANFETYLNSLDPLTISEQIHHGTGQETVRKAQWAMESLQKTLFQTFIAYREAILKLQNSWSGPAAEQMATAMTKYANWLGQLSQVATSWGSYCRRLHFAHRKVQCEVTKPDEIARNRAQAAQLRNPLRVNAALLGALDDEYSEWKTQIPAAMKRYHKNCGSIANDFLPLFKPPPPPGINPVTRVKRAPKSAPASVSVAPPPLRAERVIPRWTPPARRPPRCSIS